MRVSLETPSGRAHLHQGDCNVTFDQPVPIVQSSNNIAAMTDWWESVLTYMEGRHGYTDARGLFHSAQPTIEVLPN